MKISRRSVFHLLAAIGAISTVKPRTTPAALIEQPATILKNSITYIPEKAWRAESLTFIEKWRYATKNYKIEVDG